MAYPLAPRASPEYAYVDPQKACYDLPKLGASYHPLDAWKLLGKEPPSLARWIFHVGFGAILGVTAGVTENYLTQKPVYASIQKHFLYGFGFAALGHGLYIYNLTQAARRDAVIQHYLETHYDDFPLIHRKKIKDELKPWLPIR